MTQLEERVSYLTQVVSLTDEYQTALEAKDKQEQIRTIKELISIFYKLKLNNEARAHEGVLKALTKDESHIVAEQLP